LLRLQQQQKLMQTYSAVSVSLSDDLFLTDLVIWNETPLFRNL